MNTKDKGDIGEAFSIAELLNLGYSVSKPFGDNQRYDIIIDDGSLHRAQVKYASMQDGYIIINMETVYQVSGENFVKKYTNKQIDVIIAFCPDNKKCYWVNMREVEGLTKFRLRFEKPKSKNQHKIRMAENYELKNMEGKFIK
jgi:hypothetical protein